MRSRALPILWWRQRGFRVHGRVLFCLGEAGDSIATLQRLDPTLRSLINVSCSSLLELGRPQAYHAPPNPTRNFPSRALYPLSPFFAYYPHRSVRRAWLLRLSVHHTVSLDLPLQLEPPARCLPYWR